ncbi:MAG: beta-ketoacyl-ACP synthase [Limnospira sp.]
MAVDVVVTGIGLHSALGGLVHSWEGLLAGKSAIAPSQPFPELQPRPLALLGTQPTHLAPLLEKTLADALLDAGLQPPLSDCGIAIGSSRGYQKDLEQLAKNRTEADLSAFPHFLHSQLGTSAARQIGSLGPVLSPMAACATGLWAIAQGFELIQTGQCRRVVAGAIEAPVTPLSLIGFAKMGALASEGAFPFSRNRDGLVLGEGAALLVLEEAEFARSRGAKIYSQILGVGLSADAGYHNKPDRGGKSAIAAIIKSCDRARISPQEIDYIHAHGTATILNDRHEAKIINKLFPGGVPLSSTKGATGHSLGASGALGVAFSLMTLQHQVLPPCVGLRDLEFDLDVVKTARVAEVRRVLCLGFGFGGQNGAIVLGG